MSSQNLDKKKEIQEEQEQKQQEIPEPQLFPNLRKNVLNLDKFIDSQSKKNNIGTLGIGLNKLINKSIYKKLLLDIKRDQNNSNYQLRREIRNNYLKKLVETNSFYFPKELALDEYKKPNNPKEYKYNKYLKFMEEIAKNEKKNLKSNKNCNMNSRKESLLDNKRKRTDSIYEEVNKKKKKKKIISEVNEENDENGEANDLEESEREPSYNDNDDYEQNIDDDSQNYNYSYDEGDDDY